METFKLKAYEKIFVNPPLCSDCCQWICGKTEEIEDLYEPLVILESYTSVESMKELHPSLLLLLFSLTKKTAYKDVLLEKFPHSPESLIITEKAQYLPGPFWYLY